MEKAGLTPSEAFVASLCKSSFLSLWCIPNPPSKPGKELCDLLVVCDPDVIIFSVKEIGLKREEGGEVTEAGATRWVRKAIDESIKQLRGAERFLVDKAEVKRADGTDGPLLPPTDRRRVHRIAVAFGSEREIPYASQDDGGGGFVHVFDEVGFGRVMKELDTITDFVAYLGAKEMLLDRGPVVVFGEENLLGWYLHGGRVFPSDFDMVIVNDDWWDGLASDPGYQRGKDADKESYYWDDVIEHLLRDERTGDIKISGAVITGELATRTMARESRFARRNLARGLREFIDDNRAGRTAARAMQGGSNVGYVFLASNAPPRDRIPELTARCFITRGRMKECQTIIGLNATVADAGVAFEVVYMHHPTWTDADDAEAKKLAFETGLFATPVETHRRSDEYPPARPSGAGKR